MVDVPFTVRPYSIAPYHPVAVSVERLICMGCISSLITEKSELSSETYRRVDGRSFPTQNEWGRGSVTV